MKTTALLFLITLSSTCHAAGKWREYRISAFGIRASFPASPSQVKCGGSNAAGMIWNRLAYASKSGEYRLRISRLSMPNVSPAVMARKLISGGGNGKPGRLTPAPISYGGLKGVQIERRARPGFVEIHRVYRLNQRIVWASAIVPKDSAGKREARRFLASIARIPGAEPARTARTPAPPRAHKISPPPKAASPQRRAADPTPPRGDLRAGFFEW